jgi:hypothetical protein
MFLSVYKKEKRGSFTVSKHFSNYWNLQTGTKAFFLKNINLNFISYCLVKTYEVTPKLFSVVVFFWLYRRLDIFHWLSLISFSDFLFDSAVGCPQFFQ